MARLSVSVSPTRAAADVAGWLHAHLPEGGDLVADSRQVRPGAAFLAHPGERGDGRDHIAQAIAAGAAAVVHEAHGFAWQAQWRVPSLPVPGLRQLAGPIAAHWWGQPAERMSVTAVTGTNGKTSCTHWIAQALALQGRGCGLIGTLGAGRPGGLEPFGLTTPDAPTLQRLLAGFSAQGLVAAAIEASSIGLHQHRLAGTPVRTAVFTNLTRDHLDYHGDLHAYAHAKALLFAQPGLRAAVVNLDDPAAGTMLAAAAEDVLRIGFALDESSEPERPGGQPRGRPQQAARIDRVLRATRLVPTERGTAVRIDGHWGPGEVTLALVGRHNVQNALAVLAVLLAEGIAFEPALASLAYLAPVPGRLQTVAADGAPLAVVDYAHTPDALAQALAALAPLAAARGGRLWCLFGAGGDRDPGKRPLMGEVASRLADAVVLASDNPRSEPPESILAQIARGMARAPHRVEPDRRAAIEATLAEAHPRDVVLIAGKGHETYQEAAGRRTPFSDVQVAGAALAARAARREDAHA